jgi:hypothetical protein
VAFKEDLKTRIVMYLCEVNEDAVVFPWEDKPEMLSVFYTH